MEHEKEILIRLLKKSLADSFCFYLKAHNYHWNVTGENFPQYHDLFSDIYTEVFESIDVTAEHIRILDAFTPGSLSRFQELSDISDETAIPEAQEMVRRLLEDNEKIIRTLKATFKISESLDEFGLSDHLAARIDAHGKHGWMLKSILK